MYLSSSDTWRMSVSYGVVATGRCPGPMRDCHMAHFHTVTGQWRRSPDRYRVRPIDHRLVQHHFVMSAAGRNHREAVFLRGDGDVEKERPVAGHALRDRGIEFGGIADTARIPAEPFCHRDEVRQRLGLAMAVTPAAGAFLPFPD